MSIRLDGKVAIVTGAGSGIGRGIAMGMASAGAAVGVADVVAASAQETAEMIKARDGRAIAVQVDVTNRASIESMMEAVMGEFGRLDVLVSNAGVTNRDPVETVSEAEFDRVLGVNLKGPLLCMQAAVPRMRASGGGSIINTVSSSVQMMCENLSVYAASKGGLKVLTKAMALELAQYNIRVNGLVPHLTPTGMNRDRLTRPGLIEQQVTRIPLGRIARPEDYAGPVILLASDHASWMTGGMLWVDGGYSALG